MLERGLWTEETKWPGRREAEATQASTLPAPTPVPPAATVPKRRDAVFGEHDPLPMGKAMQEFHLGSQRVTAEELKKPEIRKFLLWKVQEATFRLQLRNLDVHILKSMGLWNEQVAAEREKLWPMCWGRGTESFVPHGDVEPLLTRKAAMERFLALHALSRVVHTWPRAEGYKSIQFYTRGRGQSLDEDTLVQVELELWSLYVQTHYDYFGLLPTLPTLMPPNPFANTHSQSSS